MNRKICFLVGWILTAHAIGLAQGRPWRVTFTTAITLDSLTHYMNLHSDVRFTFNSHRVNGKRIIPFIGVPYDLNGLLRQIKKTTGLEYVFFGRYIIFRDRVKTARPPPGTAHRRPPAGHPENTPNRAGTDTPRIREDTSAVSLGPSVTEGATQPTSFKPLRVSAPVERPHRPLPWHLQGGIFGSDALYTNVAVEAGLQPLHVVFSGGTNFRVGGWRIGLGSVIVERPGTVWQLVAGFSPLNKATRFLDSGQSINVTLRGQLYDAGIEWCKRIGTHWLIKAAAGPSLLQTTYYKGGVKTALTPYLRPGQNPDQVIYLLRPPLTIINRPGNNDSENTKVWIGATVGIYYEFTFFRGT